MKLAIFWQPKEGDLYTLENCQYKDSISHKCPKPYMIMQAFEEPATLYCQVKERYCIMVGHKVFSFPSSMIP